MNIFNIYYKGKSITNRDSQISLIIPRDGFDDSISQMDYTKWCVLRYLRTFIAKAKYMGQEPANKPNKQNELKYYIFNCKCEINNEFYLATIKAVRYKGDYNQYRKSFHNIKAKELKTSTIQIEKI